MKKTIKITLAFFLIFIFCFNYIFNIIVTAEETSSNIAGKKAEILNEEEGRYKVTVSVPGETTEITHSEVIIMLDAF